MTSEPDLAGRRPGRPRSEEVERAILDAALDALVEDGYAGVSIEGIAARAGVGKATIYRRWRSKAEIMVEALRSRVSLDVPLVDTGDLRADLLVTLRALRRCLAGVEGPLMAAFAAEKSRHPELRDEFERVFVADRRAHLRHLIAAAVERGELPADTDVEVVADSGPALLWHAHTMRDRECAADLPERIVNQILALARTPANR